MKPRNYKISRQRSDISLDFDEEKSHPRFFYGVLYATTMVVIILLSIHYLEADSTPPLTPPTQKFLRQKLLEAIRKKYRLS